MYLILERISLPHIYVALVQHAYEGRGGKGEVCPWAPNLWAPKNYNYVSPLLPILHFAMETNYYGCSQPLVTYVYWIFCMWLTYCVLSRSIEVARHVLNLSIPFKTQLQHGSITPLVVVMLNLCLRTIGLIALPWRPLYVWTGLHYLTCASVNRGGSIHVPHFTS